MSTRRRFAARASNLLAAVSAALVAVLLVATPAHAEGEVDVEINDLSDSMRAGGLEFDDFRATFTNRSGEAISGVFVVVTVSLAGAPPEAIHVQRIPGVDLPAESAGDGTVAFTDPFPFDLGRGRNDRRQVDLFLSFGDGAPDGQASITVAAYAGGELLGSADESVELSGGETRTTPPNTDPGVVPTFEAGPTYSIAPLTEAAAGPASGTVPKALYVLGSLLMVLGLVSLFLILRPPGRHLAGTATVRDPRRRRPMVFPTRPQAAADGPAHPRPPHPDALGAGAAQHWPVVGPPPQPAHRGGPARRDLGPSGGGRAGERGPHTGATRPVRDPTPDDPRWHYD
jgi:hypothetical protein